MTVELPYFRGLGDPNDLEIHRCDAGFAVSSPSQGLGPVTVDRDTCKAILQRVEAAELLEVLDDEPGCLILTISPDDAAEIMARLH